MSGARVSQSHTSYESQPYATARGRGVGSASGANYGNASYQSYRITSALVSTPVLPSLRSTPQQSAVTSLYQVPPRKMEQRNNHGSVSGQLGRQGSIAPPDRERVATYMPHGHLEPIDHNSKVHADANRAYGWTSMKNTSSHFIIFFLIPFLFLCRLLGKGREQVFWLGHQA